MSDSQFNSQISNFKDKLLHYALLGDNALLIAGIAAIILIFASSLDVIIQFCCIIILIISLGTIFIVGFFRRRYINEFLTQFEVPKITKNPSTITVINTTKQQLTPKQHNQLAALTNKALKTPF